MTLDILCRCLGAEKYTEQDNRYILYTHRKKKVYSKFMTLYVLRKYARKHTYLTPVENLVSIESEWQAGKVTVRPFE